MFAQLQIRAFELYEEYKALRVKPIFRYQTIPMTEENLAVHLTYLENQDDWH